MISGAHSCGVAARWKLDPLTTKRSAPNLQLGIVGGWIMLRGVRAGRPLSIGFLVILLGCAVPPLESQFEHGPTVSDVVRHIEYELASLVNGVKVDQKHHVVKVKNNKRLAQLICEDSRYPQTARDLEKLLSRLTDDHFVASALMSLDVMDTEGINPSLTFITPLNMTGSYSRTGAIGGSLSGTQERNIQLGYSIDFDQLLKIRVPSFDLHCDAPNYGIANVGPENGTGFRGDLGLTDIVVDGLNGLNVSSKSNIYGSSGPVGPTVTRNLVIPAPPSYKTSYGPVLIFPKDKPEGLKSDPEFSGSITLSPSTTGTSALGSANLAATTTFAITQNSKNKEGNYNYFINLSGQSITQYDKETNILTDIVLSLTGTVLQSSKLPDVIDGVTNGTALNLTGQIPVDIKGEPVLECLSLSGTLGMRNVTLSYPYAWAESHCENVKAEIQKKMKQGKPSVRAIEKNSFYVGAPFQPQVSQPGGAKGAAPAAPSAAGNSTLFGTLVSFVVSYGVNGGPNWTLQTFKGPSGGGGGGGSSGGSSSGTGGGSGGGGGSGQLFNLNRTDTDQLTITFVAACQTKAPIKAADYWQSLPECDLAGMAKQGANGLALQNNLLIQSARGF